MILCDGCDKWQHAVCFRILQEGDVPTSHVCEICAKLKVIPINFFQVNEIIFIRFANIC